MISPRLDYWVERAKWTAATLALLSAPVTLLVLLWHIWLAITTTPIYLLMFCGGMVLVGFAARSTYSNSYMVRKAFRWLHDTTQSIVIQVVLHPLATTQSILSRFQFLRSKFRPKRDVEVIPPRSFEERTGKNSDRAANPGDEWLARDNWLLLAAPYAVPLSTVILWIPSLILFAPLRSAILGIGLGVHLGYVVYHWRRQSAELRQLGDRFNWMFLPAANLLVASVVFSFAMGGFAGVWNFMVDWITLPWDTLALVWNWFLPTTPLELSK